MQMRSTTIVSALLCLVSLPAWSQSNGSISGTIKDPNGAVVQGAQVAVASQILGIRQSTTSNSTGDFLFAQLPPGTYQLTVEASGFKKKENSNVALLVSSKISVGDINLEVGSLTETITVEASAATIQIQSETGERSNTLTNKQLR